MTTHHQAIQSPHGVGNPTASWRAVCSCGAAAERESEARAHTAALAHNILIAQAQQSTTEDD